MRFLHRFTSCIINDLQCWSIIVNTCDLKSICYRTHCLGHKSCIMHQPGGFKKAVQLGTIYYAQDAHECESTAGKQGKGYRGGGRSREQNSQSPQCFLCLMVMTKCHLITKRPRNTFRLLQSTALWPQALDCTTTYIPTMSCKYMFSFFKKTLVVESPLVNDYSCSILVIRSYV